MVEKLDKEFIYSINMKKLEKSKKMYKVTYQGFELVYDEEGTDVFLTFPNAWGSDAMTVGDLKCLRTAINKFLEKNGK